jgi:CHASE2 domain-containing sensor protein
VPRQATGDVVVVAIDAPSIEKIGVWPWPRRLHADLLRRLESADVPDIVFDVDFSTPSDAAADQAFTDALRSAGGSVVCPSFKQPGAYGGDATAVHINRPLRLFGEHSWPAVVNVAIEPDGLVRHHPFPGGARPHHREPLSRPVEPPGWLTSQFASGTSWLAAETRSCFRISARRARQYSR